MFFKLDNTSLIDLTKENDDVMIISVENTGTDVARNRTNRVTRLASQRFASAYNSSNSSLPTNSSSGYTDSNSSFLNVDTITSH